MGAVPCKVGCHMCANDVLPLGNVSELQASSSAVPGQQDAQVMVKQVSPALPTNQSFRASNNQTYNQTAKQPKVNEHIKSPRKQKSMNVCSIMVLGLLCISVLSLHACKETAEF